MKSAHCAALGLFIAIGGFPVYSQQSPVPFGQLEKDAQMQTFLAAKSPAEIGIAGVSSSSSSSSFGFVYQPPASPVHYRVMDRRYLLLNGIHLAMSFADMEMTQHCIAEHKCREGNPLMPSSQAGRISINLALVTYTAANSYWFKKHNSRVWWLAPAIGIAAHTAGFATGFFLR